MSSFRRTMRAECVVGLAPGATVKRVVHAVLGWIALFGFPALLVVIAVSVMAALFRSHDCAALDEMADARARVTLSVAASRLTRLAAWDSSFLSFEPLFYASSQNYSASTRDGDEGASSGAIDVAAGNLSRVRAVLSSAYLDETSLHWIAVVDRDGVIRVGSDATASGTALPTEVRNVLRQQVADCRLHSVAIVAEWSVVHAGERFIGRPVFDAFGQIVAFAVIGVDAHASPRKGDGGVRQEPDKTTVARIGDTATPYLLVGGALASILSVLAALQARRRPVLLRIWRVGVKRAHCRRRALLAVSACLDDDVAPMPSRALSDTSDMPLSTLTHDGASSGHLP